MILKKFSPTYVEKKWDLHISFITADRGPDLFLLQDHCTRHSTTVLSGTEIKDPANELSSAINKTGRQWDLRVSIKTDISKIYGCS